MEIKNRRSSARKIVEARKLQLVDPAFTVAAQRGTCTLFPQLEFKTFVDYDYKDRRGIIVVDNIPVKFIFI